MQYLLTEEEMVALDERARAGDEAPSKKELQEFCTMVANNLVLKSGWQKGKVWGCVLTSNYEWYCDDCPAQKICPYEYKRYSK